MPAERGPTELKNLSVSRPFCRRAVKPAEFAGKPLHSAEISTPGFSIAACAGTTSLRGCLKNSLSPWRAERPPMAVEGWGEGEFLHNVI